MTTSQPFSGSLSGAAATANNTVVHMMDTGAPVNDGNILGYPFLRQFGVIGFNHRTHQVILYK